jgi:hypothetical protein
VVIDDARAFQGDDVRANRVFPALRNIHGTRRRHREHEACPIESIQCYGCMIHSQRNVWIDGPASKKRVVRSMVKTSLRASGGVENLN